MFQNMNNTRALLVVVIAFGALSCIFLSGRAPTECNCENPILINSIQAEYPKEIGREQVGVKTQTDHVDVISKKITTTKHKIGEVRKSKDTEPSMPNNRLQNYFMDLWTSVIKKSVYIMFLI